MCKKRLILISAVLMILTSGGIRPAHTQTRAQSMLSGVKGVEVVIQFLFADVEKGGLNGPELKAAVEARLRDGGVEVFDGQILRPKLYIKIGALKVEQIKHYIYSVDMEVREHAVLSRNAKLNSFALSWTTQPALGIVPASSMAPSLQEVVMEMVDRLISDFASA